MRARLLLGPAGSGKTHCCLDEIRASLLRSPEGLPLVLLAPNQTTYQLERQLLSDPALGGYTRLHIVSFERLAHLLLEWLGQPSPKLLDEEGRVMVLRALLARNRKELKLFRASARLTGFAQELSNVLRELQQSEHTPESLRELAAGLSTNQSLSCKLQDFAVLLEQYGTWLKDSHLQDADCLLDEVTELLTRPSAPRPPLRIEALWVDGFAEFTGQEVDFLAALLPYAGQSTLTFCLDRPPGGEISWLSNWCVAQRNYEAVQKRLRLVSGVEIAVERIRRAPTTSRFQQNRVLRHLEEHWDAPQPLALSANEVCADEISGSVRALLCTDPAAEVSAAAREILSFVRKGGRYRDVTVLVRNLDTYQDELRRTFTRFEIPYFLDRRDSMAHHPAAELTRSALRTAILGWQHEDWFAALKTGLLPAREEEIDRLENEALARGWRGPVWLQPLKIKETGRSPESEQQLRELEAELEKLRRKLVRPFQKLAFALKSADNKPTGAQLAAALREFWDTLEVADRLQDWAAVSGGEQQDVSPHETVWSQLNGWADNAELAFAEERLAARDWLPVLEAGLANLTVGQIPPGLDQVLIGAIDRSRNQDVKLAIVLGMNEAVFPATPPQGGLLTASDRTELDGHQPLRVATTRQQLSRERHYAYLVCTRARERLVLTCAAHDSGGKALNISPFLTHIQRILPQAGLQPPEAVNSWPDCLHVLEFVECTIRSFGTEAEEKLAAISPLIASSASSTLSSVRCGLTQFKNAAPLTEALDRSIAARLYGPALRTSVSRMEQFAACPFKFFIHSGLRAQERKRFELDFREQGSFQHDVLALFHQQLSRENKRWRDITPTEARDRVEQIAKAMLAGYREGLLAATPQTQFMARVLTESLQDFVETLVDWMRKQYQFDPATVELPFGAENSSPAWSIALGDGRALELYGRIDRVDLLARPGTDEALCIVLDYKSSAKRLDPVLVAKGLQLQLLAYANVLRHWQNPLETFGVSRLLPAGVFYVSLREKRAYEPNRSKALGGADQARKLAYRHTGRFDATVVSQLDSRPGNEPGDQFNFRRNKDGSLSKACREPVDTDSFRELLDSVENALRDMGRQVFAGVADVAPFKKGALTACTHCEYQAVCRIDPWTHRFRVLSAEKREEKAGR